MLPMTKLDIAKYVVSLAVALKTTEICETQVAQHTQLDPDGIPVKIGCAVAGQMVAYKSKPYTDVMVERAANWLSETFNKNTPTNEYKSNR